MFDPTASQETPYRLAEIRRYADYRCVKEASIGKIFSNVPIQSLDALGREVEIEPDSLFANLRVAFPDAS